MLGSTTRGGEEGKEVVEDIADKARPLSNILPGGDCWLTKISGIFCGSPGESWEGYICMCSERVSGQRDGREGTESELEAGVLPPRSQFRGRMSRQPRTAFVVDLRPLASLLKSTPQ